MKIDIRQPDGSTKGIPVCKELITFGRSDDNDVVLPHATVSRRHASLKQEPDGTMILTDLGSANGMSLNGQIVEGEAKACANDTFEIGPFHLTLREEESDSPFAIQAAAVDLDQLRQDPRLLDLPAEEAPGLTGQLRSFELLYEAGMTLSAAHSVEEVVDLASNLLFRIENVMRATLLLWNEEKSSFEDAGMRVKAGGVGFKLGAPYDPRKLVMSHTILDRVKQANRPILIRDARHDRSLDSAASIVLAGIQAALCSPLFNQDRFLGVLYADNLVEPNAFSDSGFRTFTAIAAQAGLALGNAVINRELVRREVQRQALKAYLPPQVAELVLSSEGGANIGGVLQSISVLFADIRDFTRISEHMDARELVGMLNRFFTEMSSVIFRHNGTVDKFIGDCVMALFGAPLSCADSADQAMAAAIEMQNVLALLRDDPAASALKDIQIGIGLHTGLAVVGNVGSEERLQYTAIGDTVNVASRLVSLAKAGQIILSEDCRKALSSSGDLTFIGETALKGRRTKLNLYSARWQQP